MTPVDGRRHSQRPLQAQKGPCTPKGFFQRVRRAERFGGGSRASAPSFRRYNLIYGNESNTAQTQAAYGLTKRCNKLFLKSRRQRARRAKDGGQSQKRVRRHRGVAPIRSATPQLIGLLVGIGAPDAFNSTHHDACSDVLDFVSVRHPGPVSSGAPTSPRIGVFVHPVPSNWSIRSCEARASASHPNLGPCSTQFASPRLTHNFTASPPGFAPEDGQVAPARRRDTLFDVPTMLNPPSATHPQGRRTLVLG